MKKIYLFFTFLTAFIISMFIFNDNVEAMRLKQINFSDVPDFLNYNLEDHYYIDRGNNRDEFNIEIVPNGSSTKLSISVNDSNIQITGWGGIGRTTYLLFYDRIHNKYIFKFQAWSSSGGNYNIAYDKVFTYIPSSCVYTMTYKVSASSPCNLISYAYGHWNANNNYSNRSNYTRNFSYDVVYDVSNNILTNPSTIQNLYNGNDNIELVYSNIPISVNYESHPGLNESYYKFDYNDSIIDVEFINYLNLSKKVTIKFDKKYIDDTYIYSYKFVNSFEQIIEEDIDIKFDYNGFLESYINIIDNGLLTIYIKDKYGDIYYEEDFNISDLNNFIQRAAFDSNGNGNDMYSLNIKYYSDASNMGINSNSNSHYIPFAIMYYSNDFSDINTPRIIDYKAYYIYHDSKYDADSDKLYIDKFVCNNYGNQVICSGAIVDTTLGRYGVEVDIKFNNIDNYSLHYFDKGLNLYEYRDIDVLSNSFVGYTKYKIPDNSSKVYIYKRHINQNQKTGNVIFPTYYTFEDYIDIKATYYNRNQYITYYSFSNDDYYSVYDFDLTNDEVLVLSYNNVNTCNADVFGKVIECQHDNMYIYVSNDFLVRFNYYSNSDFKLTDDDGNDIYIDQDYNNSNFINKNDSFIDLFKDSFNNFSSSIRYIVNMISTIWNGFPVIIKSFFVIIFVLSISIIIFKFIL